MWFPHSPTPHSTRTGAIRPRQPVNFTLGNTMRARKMAAFSLLLTQLGCVPNALTYYHPSMDGGQVLARHCVPTESIIEFGPLPIEASVIEGHNAWFAVLGLPSKRPPKLSWQTFHFATSDFYIRDSLTGVTTDKLPISVLRDDKSDTVREPYRPPSTKGWLFSIDVKLPGPPPERFELLLPPVVIDGKEVRFPPIRFERKIWMGVSPFNC